MATISITHAFLFLVLAQGDALRVLGPDPSPRQMMTAYLNRLADKALAPETLKAVLPVAENLALSRMGAKALPRGGD